MIFQFNSVRSGVFQIGLLLALLFVPLFSHLGHLPIRLWDESRLACNAMEMAETGNLLVTQYQGSPDMWNTKPPLMIWLQASGIQLFGASEFAVRLPSALAALATCLLLFWFGRRMGLPWLGFLAVLVLVTSSGYTGEHAARTGDYDALLTLFTTAGVLLWYLWCEDQKPKYLYWFFVLLMLGVLTKGVAGLLFVPALGLYALLQKRVGTLLRSRHFYLGLAGFLLPIAAYYVGREAVNPGYLQAVWENELGGRYADSLENHHGGFWFYWDLIINQRFALWYLLVPCGLALGFWSADGRLRKLTTFFTLSVVTYFLVISSAETKLAWYDVPLYPLLALLVALPLQFVVGLLTKIPPARMGLRTNVLPAIFGFLVFLGPYEDCVYRTYKPNENPAEWEFYEMSRLLQKAAKGKLDMEGQRLVYDGYHAHLLFYIKGLQSQGIDVDITHIMDLREGDKIMVPQNRDKHYLKSRFQVTDERMQGSVLMATFGSAMPDALPE